MTQSITPVSRAPDDTTLPPVSARRRWIILLLLCLATLIAQLDTALVNLAVRPIGDHFHAGMAALQWVVDGYNLVYTILLLTGGLLADLYGRRRTFMAGVILFTAASLLCALAPTMGWLIAGRALTGVGAAFLIPAALAIIRIVWTTPAERGRVLGIWTACNGLAAALGPTAGGLLIHMSGWRSIFYVVVPIGVVVVALAVATIPESADPSDRQFDLPGQISGAAALAALSLAAILLQDHVAGAALALVVAVIAGGVFVRVERQRGASALVPLDLFALAGFRAAIIATAGMTFAMYGVLFLLPMTWLKTGFLDMVGAGLALMPMALIFVLTSPFSAWAERHIGTRTIIGCGVGLIGAGLFVIAYAATLPAFLLFETGLAATGLGMGMATGPLTGIALGTVPPARAGTASAVFNIARMAGASLGVAMLGTVHAISGGGYPGLTVAMASGGTVALVGAGCAWRILGRGGGGNRGEG